MDDHKLVNPGLWTLLQVLEAARDLLKQSQESALTSLYFYDLSDRLERLLYEVKLL